MKITLFEEKSPTTERSSLILNYANGTYRRKQALKIYCPTHPKNLKERKAREEAFLLAQRILNEKQGEILRGEYELPERYKTTKDFFPYAWNYVSQLEGVLVETKKYIAMLHKLEAFLGKKTLPCYELTEALIIRFVKYMESHLRGETPQGYLNRLKIIIKAAESENYFKKNPAANVRARKIGSVQKAVLTVDEIRILWNMPLANDEVRRAFLFACTTALRFCDVKELTWSNIQGNELQIIQKKTKQLLTLPLTDEALSLLGIRGKDNDKVFHLPSHTAVMKWMRVWAKDAEIGKKVTFHCARHSLATNLISNNVNLAVTSKILGHTNISQTQRYVRISEDLKREALNQISFFNNQNK